MKLFKYIKRMILNIIVWIIRKMPLSNTIVFESIPDLADNSKAVFDEMMNRGLNNKYRLVWWVDDINKYKNYNVSNVYFYDNIHGKMNYLKKEYFLSTAKCLIFCNKFLYKVKKKQVSIYLTHGNVFKNVKEYYNIPDEIDFVLSPSKEISSFLAYNLSASIEKMIPIGLPRNDVLRKCSGRTKEILDCTNSKVIIWYPTYRQHKNVIGLTNCTLSIPILGDESAAIAINEIAIEKDVLIVVKPHFAQDVSKIKILELSNIRFIDDDFYIKNNITSYEFLSGTDALLTDYSSVCHDYTLCDKPIGLIWEDVEEYRAKPGFCKGIEPYLEGYEKLYTVDDLKAFIERVADDIDLLREKRNEIKYKLNTNADNECVGNVVNFIIEKAKL